MKPALVHFHPRQKQRLTRRAQQRGRSFSQEVRNAVDLYLELPPEAVEEFEGLAAAARQSIDRTLARLDDAISSVDEVLKRREKGR